MRVVSDLKLACHVGYLSRGDPELLSQNLCTYARMCACVCVRIVHLWMQTETYVRLCETLLHNTKALREVLTHTRMHV